MNGHEAESFSSLPPEEEAQFRVYEERMRAAERSSMRLGFGIGAVVLVATVIAIIAFWGPVKPLIPEEAAPAAQTGSAAAPAAPAPAPAPAPAASGAAPAAPTDSAAAPAAAPAATSAPAK